MTLATITQLVDDKLRSAALGDLADPAVRDRAIAQAVLQYSTDAPRAMVVDVVGVSGYTFAVPTGWVVGRSQLDFVEYPIGLLPINTASAATVYDGTTWMIILEEPLSAATVRVHFGSPHTLSGTVSTIPAEHENALACWATAELCRQLATQKGHERDATLSAAAVNGQSQSGDLARRAKDWLLQYRTTLGLPDPEKLTGGQGTGAVVTFARDRVRGRLHSLGY